MLVSHIKCIIVYDVLSLEVRLVRMYQS